jgi:hypothetical protein
MFNGLNNENCKNKTENSEGNGRVRTKVNRCEDDGFSTRLVDFMQAGHMWDEFNNELKNNYFHGSSLFDLIFHYLEIH